MDWIAIIEAFLPLIRECLNRDDEDAVRKNIRNPGPWQMVRIRQHHRKQGLRGLELRKAVTETVEQCRNCTDEELDHLIEEAKA